MTEYIAIGDTVMSEGNALHVEASMSWLLWVAGLVILVSPIVSCSSAESSPSSSLSDSTLPTLLWTIPSEAAGHFVYSDPQVLSRY